MKMKALKLVALIKTHRGRRILYCGTIAQLADAFGYTLDCGNSWDCKIKTAREIKTLKSLVSNINKSYDGMQCSCFGRDYVEEGNHLLTEEVKAAWAAEQDKWSIAYSTFLEA